MKSSERALSPDINSGRKGLKVTEGHRKRPTDGSSNSAYSQLWAKELGPGSCGQVDQIRVAQVTGAQAG